MASKMNSVPLYANDSVDVVLEEESKSESEHLSKKQRGERSKGREWVKEECSNPEELLLEDVPIGQKRKRGRPSKAKKALIRQ
jgi:hypothetical protein